MDDVCMYCLKTTCQFCEHRASKVLNVNFDDLHAENERLQNENARLRETLQLVLDYKNQGRLHRIESAIKKALEEMKEKKDATD